MFIQSIVIFDLLFIFSNFVHPSPRLFCSQDLGKGIQTMAGTFERSQNPTLSIWTMLAETAHIQDNVTEDSNTLPLAYLAIGLKLV